MLLDSARNGPRPRNGRISRSGADVNPFAKMFPNIAVSAASSGPPPRRAGSVLASAGFATRVDGPRRCALRCAAAATSSPSGTPGAARAAPAGFTGRHRGVNPESSDAPAPVPVLPPAASPRRRDPVGSSGGCGTVRRLGPSDQAPTATPPEACDPVGNQPVAQPTRPQGGLARVRLFTTGRMIECHLSVLCERGRSARIAASAASAPAAGAIAM